MWDMSAASRSRSHRFIRDVFEAWNREWLPEKPRTKTSAPVSVIEIEEVAPNRKYQVQKSAT
jgi:hypothetical protein